MAVEPGNAGPFGTVQIPCTDAFQRHRAVTLWASPDHGQVVLVAPAGEAARLTPEEARVLAGQLVVHADRLDAQRRALRKRSRQKVAGVVRLPVRGQVV